MLNEEAIFGSPSYVKRTERDRERYIHVAQRGFIERRQRMHIWWFKPTAKDQRDASDHPTPFKFYTDVPHKKRVTDVSYPQIMTAKQDLKISTTKVSS